MFDDWLPSALRSAAPRAKRAPVNRIGGRLRRLQIEPLEDRHMLAVIAWGDGSGNTTAPADDPGFANVGWRGGGTAVYLGGGWALTAAHVGAGDTSFGGVGYTAVPNSAVLIANPTGAGWTPFTDLLLYKLNGTPNLPSILINDSAPAVGWDVTMIGRGRDRQASLAHWTSTWAPSATPSTYSGYIWGGTQSIRWGTNVISSVNVPQGIQANSQMAFTTTFDATGGTLYEAQGAVGDSGGAVFHKDTTTGQWELTGLMFSIDTYGGQPWGTSVFGNRTYSADLSIYRNLILQTIAFNHAPSGTDATVGTLSDSTYTFATSDFGFSDLTDSPAHNLLAVKISTLPTIGALTNNGVAVASGQFIAAADVTAGKLKFTPAVGTNGSPYATFTFQVQDDGGTAGGGIDLDPSANTITINVTTLDTTPPTVTGFTPASTATGVAVNTPVKVFFSETLDASTVNATTVRLLDNGLAVTASVSYDAATRTATLTPAVALANSRTYTIQVTGGAGGVKDAAGNALATSVGSLFTTAPLVTTFSLFGSTGTPAIVDSGDAQAVEVGVKIRSDVNGYITGLRFYKSAANTGTHTANLWTASGQLLATAVSTGETASGWQQVNFATPVAITAGTTYVASYHTTSGRYSLTRNFYNTAAVNGPLTGLANSVSANGVYRYGASSLFPNQSYQATNYWVDAILSTTPPVDTTPPTVTGFTPASTATGVAVNTQVKVFFSEAMDASTVNATTVRLLDNGLAVTASVSYDAATRTATLTPAVALANSRTYTIQVTGGAGGVRDAAGNALATSVGSLFTTAPLVTTFSLFGSTGTPAIVDSGDAQAVEVGVKIRSDVNGYITGLRFYKSAANTGTHTANLWTASGQLLATAVSTGETASGWQQVNFATPMAITAGTTYVASYHTTSGRYSLTRNFYNTAAVNGPLTGLANSVSANGVYRYGASSLFPNQSYQATNYWVDAILSTTPPVDTTPPTVTGFTPASTATGVAVNTPVKVFFSEAMDASTVNATTVRLLDNGLAVTASVSYDAATRTATLTPAVALANSRTYTIQVTGGAGGVKDAAGNALATSVGSLFTTIGALSPPTSFWSSSTVPTIADSGDGQAIALGVQFRSDVNGFVTGIRFYKSAANTGVHTGSLWSSTGQLLATGTFTGETASGWQQMTFSSPVAITAGTTYVASYHTTAGRYSVNRNYFTSQFTSGHLQALPSGGVYKYGTSAVFPTQSYQASNYWVDVLFST